jgi:low affinity Fe/Cu permease
MVFIIANVQKRDSDALNSKLDALIAVNRRLNNKALGIESATEERVRELREELEAAISHSDTA